MIGKNKSKDKDIEEIVEVAEEKKPVSTGSIGSLPPTWHKPSAGALGIEDEDEKRAMSEAVRFMFDFPVDRLLSWTRWRRREIPLLASELTKQMATNPNRPRNADGSKKSLSMINIENIAWLRLAEEGAQRNEGMGVFQTQTEEKMTADAWKE